jgi:transglutaminase-like putative cysteine protease
MKKSPAALPWWDWSAVALSFLLIEILATRLVNTSWTPFLHTAQMCASLGFIIGIILGYSRFKRGTARWLSLLFMMLLIPLQWTSVIDRRVPFEEKLVSVAGRLFFSISELIAQRPVEDPLFFVAVMCLTFWIVSVSAGFALTRYQSYLWAVIPAGIGMLVIQHFDNLIPGRVWVIGLFLFIALALLGRMHFLQNRNSWKTRRIFISADNSIDLANGMAVMAGVIVLIAFIVPASRAGVESAINTWNRVTQPWEDFTEKLENAVSAVEAPTVGSPGEYYGTELNLGNGFPLSDAFMFQVTTPELPSGERPPRYYWRGRTYDYFKAGQWFTTGTVRQSFSPTDNPPILTGTENLTPKEFTFRIGDSRTSLLYAPSQPVWLSRPGSYLATSTITDTDIISWHAVPSLLPGEFYKVQSVVRNPNTKQLREAGTDYPEWVTERYLQVPDDVSPRIAELAEEITADYEYPFDKAAAVTRYLRTNIQYSPSVPEAPRGKDSLEWVLFEHKKAYCVYYASAEVLMLRSLGIPARLAVGFAQGTVEKFEREQTGMEQVIPNSFIVRESEAHAWPEVYFPGIGWVEFEPTGNQSALDRPLPPRDPLAENGTLNPSASAIRDDLLEPDGLEAREEPDAAPDTPLKQAVFPPFYLIPLFIVLAALTVFLTRRYNLATRVPTVLRASFERNGGQAPGWLARWEQWTLLSPIEKSFESINFGLRLLKKRVPIHATPIERAEALTKIMPNLAGQIKVLLDEHQTSLYTFRMADANRARQSAFDIRLQSIIARLRRF